MKAQQRQLRLDRVTRPRDCVAVDGHENETTPLVEAQRVDVVVGRDQPQPLGVRSRAR